MSTEPRESEPLQLIVELRYKQEHVEGAEERAVEFVRRTREEAGCERAFFFRVNEDAERFVFLAEFADVESLKAHLDAPWREEVIDQLAEYLIERPRRFTMTRVA